jgi:hypothetical protein
MAFDTAHKEGNREGKPTSPSGWSAEHGDIIIQDDQRVAGSSAGSPTAVNYPEDKQPGDQGGLERDETDEETLEMGNNPDAIRDLQQEEGNQAESVTGAEALSRENTGGDAAENKNRPSGL